MKCKLLVPILVLSFVMGACSLGLPGQGAAAPTQTAAQIAPTAQGQATDIIQPAQTSTAEAPTPAGGAGTASVGSSTPAATIGTTATPAAAQANQNLALANQPAEIKGNFSFTNDIILTYYVENAVAMTDMYGFIKRDQQWVVPVSSQVLGFLAIDAAKKTGTFDLKLPELPTGEQVNVDPQSPDYLKPGAHGVQIFALDYSPNLAGGPYSEGDDPEYGWPTYLASVKTDSGNNDEVVGGKLVIWSPDGQESFPSGFGTDGLLFTKDDPVMKVPQGYSVIDLDQKPFKVIRDAQPQMTLYEPKEAAIKDFSNLSYKDAFDQMFAVVRKEYAFNGIDSKSPNWDQLYAQLSPRVQQASQNKDAKAFYEVMHDFTLAFKDGHVGLNGGDVGQSILRDQIAGGYGFAVRQLDDGRVMVVDVVKGTPAEQGGMKTGAVVTQFNGKPIDQAIQAVNPLGPESTTTGLREQQTRYLVRAPLGAKASVTFTNPGSSTAQTIQLTAVDERESLTATSPYKNADPNALPVEYFVVTTSSVGYVKINSNYDDLNLIVRLFMRALTKFKENNLNTLIIDMRVNSGGSNLGLAGFLTNKEIPMGQLQYYSEKTGKFEPEGPESKILPNVEQFSFKKEFLLVDDACASACELEAYGFSQVPGMVVLGQHPTSGTEAEVSRGQFKLPEGMSLQVPTGRFILPDGSLFLEGKGVQPTVHVPIDENTVLSQQDPVIQKALQMAGQ